jgi:ribose transport system permease protein
MTFVILSSGIDLSVGAVMALAAISAAWTTSVLAGSTVETIPGLAMLISIVVGLAFSAIVGLINGVLISNVGLSPFITTLGMLSVVRGLCYFATGGQTTQYTGADAALLSSTLAGRFLGIPAPLIFLLVVGTTATIVLHHTAWGRYAKAIGGNERAAELTGIPVRKVKISIYIVASLLAGFDGIVMSAWLGSAPANLAVGYELNVIAAVVIGGANLVGGTGSPFGSVLGCILIEVIRNGLVLIGVNSYAQSTFVGLIIIAAVITDRARSWRDSR